MLSQTPPMGWNSWNTFGEKISETLIRETADAMHDNGLSDAGYRYVVIDDCWSQKKRDENGRLQPDPAKFPSGLKSLSDYVHSKSMKFGMYSCCGTRTCADYPGSYEYEFTDAETFADWGVDFLKYDYCYKPRYIEGHLLYKRMAMALRSCGRDILFSACSWGADNAESFMRNAGIHMWRSTGDIFDNWESIKGIIYKQINLAPYGAPGCFNDMDMLVVGMHGKGNVGLGGCTDEEYKTHFSAWCLFNSPLMIGCDVRNLDDASRKILTNRELIAINQDPEGRQPWFALNEYENLVCVRPLSDGSYALGFFNMSDSKKDIYLNFWDIGLPTESGRALFLRDLWLHEDIGVFREGIRVPLEPHACSIYSARITKS
ncbi:MAG TPA: glycoside hydrolase family 27 protein [Caproiciproducens sp.]|nr:glycoside hydrolase family 27 protein [Caproiciproducens sp.]